MRLARMQSYLVCGDAGSGSIPLVHARGGGNTPLGRGIEGASPRGGWLCGRCGSQRAGGLLQELMSETSRLDG